MRTHKTALFNAVILTTGLIVNAFLGGHPAALTFLAVISAYWWYMAGKSKGDQS